MVTNPIRQFKCCRDACAVEWMRSHRSEAEPPWIFSGVGLLDRCITPYIQACIRDLGIMG